MLCGKISCQKFWRSSQEAKHKCDLVIVFQKVPVPRDSEFVPDTCSSEENDIELDARGKSNLSWIKKIFICKVAQLNFETFRPEHNEFV